MFASGQGTKGQKETLQEIGMDKSKFYDEKGNLKSTLEITKAINDSMEKAGVNTAEKVIKLFGEDIGQSALPLFSKEGIAGVEEALRKIRNAQGTTEDKRRIQEGSIYNQFQSIKSAGEEITIRLFGGDEKHLADILGRIADKMRQFAGFLKANAGHINAFFDYIKNWFDKNDKRILKFFFTIGKALLDVGKVFGKLTGFLVAFALRFQGIVAFLLKFWIYSKAINIVYR